jgi:hypothetical protein
MRTLAALLIVAPIVILGLFGDASSLHAAGSLHAGTFSSKYVTRSQLQAVLHQLATSFYSEFYGNLVGSPAPPSSFGSGGIWNSIALTNDIDQLTGVRLSGVSVNGVSGLTASDIPAINLATGVSGTLSASLGGTGWSALSGGSLLVGSGSSPLATSSNLFWDNTNARLGIGSSSPNSALTINGSGYFLSGLNVDYAGSYQQGGSRMLFVSSGASFGDGTVILGQRAGANLATSTTLSGVAIDGLGTIGASGNVAVGGEALQLATSTGFNTAIGHTALQWAQGNYNTAFGWSAQWQGGPGTAAKNTMAGYEPLLTNINGNRNTAFGNNALDFLDDAGATGFFGIQLSTGAPTSDNVAIGASAMGEQTTGLDNTAIGVQAMFDHLSGTTTTAVGNSACNGVSTKMSAQGNVCIGLQAGRSFGNAANYNTLVGLKAGNGITGTTNIVLGPDTTTNGTRTIGSGSNNIVIGIDINAHSLTGSNQLNIGNILFGSGLTGTGSTVTGKIGLGTTTPASILEEYVSNTNTTLTTFGNPALTVTNPSQTGNTFSSLAFRSVNSSGSEFTGARLSGVFTNHTAASQSSDLVFLTNNAGTITEQARLTAAGKLGIGTSTPDQLVAINSATSPSLELSAGGGANQEWTIGIDTADSNKLKIASSTAVGANARLTIDGGGNVGIASTSPWRALSVVGTAAFSGLTSSATGNALCITSGKEITDAGGGTCTPSSIRFKENVQTLTPGFALDELDRLHVVAFDYKPGDYSPEDSPHSYGMIAEEVQTVDPNLVDFGYDGQPLTLHFEKITGLTVQAIQELNLDLEAIASTTASTTPGNPAFGRAFLASLSARMVNWLADSTNGIGKLLVHEAHADQLCARRSDDTYSCATGDQLEALVSRANSAAP